ncbi:MAG: DUF2142 domain-containing protein [Pseudobutyrivibrio sp.]|nr:DUF2142 domain-containing protein [Pseudobutyrivibrio sp.]
MEKIKSFFYPMTKEKAFKIAALALGVVGMVFATVFFITNCFYTSKSKFFNGYFAVILLMMIALTIYLLRFLLLDKQWSYSRVFVVLAIGWSVCLQLVMPPLSGADETKHFYSAYHCSNIYLGIKDHDFDTTPGSYGNWFEGTTYFEMRAEDYYKLPWVDVTFPYQYEILADGNWFHTDKDMKALVPCYIKPTQARRYLLSGLGIAIGRFLGFGLSGIIFLGRFMNSLTLILAGWMCIKLLPVGKLQLINFALFPAILGICGSYSYDNMSVLFSFILLTLCLYLSQENVKLHAWHIYLIAIVVAILIPNKMVYVLFGIWFFAIPLKKWWTDVGKSKKWYEYLLAGGFIAGAIVALKKIVPKYSYILYDQFILSHNHVGIEQDPSRVAYTMYDFIDRPGEVFSLAWHGIKEDFWYNLSCVVGRELGHTNLGVIARHASVKMIPMACIIVLLAVLIIGLIINKGKRLKKWQLVIIALGLIACLLAVFAGCLVRFTPNEAGTSRIQISYRYLFPLYMCLCIALGSDAKENKKAFALIFIQNITLIFAMCGLIYFFLHLRELPVDPVPAVPEVLQQLGIQPWEF